MFPYLIYIRYGIKGLRTPLSLAYLPKINTLQRKLRNYETKIIYYYTSFLVNLNMLFLFKILLKKQKNKI